MPGGTLCLKLDKILSEESSIGDISLFPPGTSSHIRNSLSSSSFQIICSSRFFLNLKIGTLFLMSLLISSSVYSLCCLAGCTATSESFLLVAKKSNNALQMMSSLVKNLSFYCIGSRHGTINLNHADDKAGHLCACSNIQNNEAYEKNCVSSAVMPTLQGEKTIDENSGRPLTVCL